MNFFYFILVLMLVSFFMAGCQDQKVMNELEIMKAQSKLEKQNIELVTKVYTEWNKRNLDLVSDLHASDYAYYSPVGNPKPMSLEETKKMVKMLWNAFPDLTLNVEESFASGDKVICMLKSKGTHKGEFMGIPATGNKMESSGVSIIRIKDGKIAEEWETFDMLGLMMQLNMELKPQSSK